MSRTQKELDVTIDVATGTAPDGATCPFDHHAAELRGPDKYDVYAGLRERRVQRSDRYGGFWILSHAADVEAALLDHTTYSSQLGGVTLPASPAPPIAGLEHDPPEHGPFRRLFSKAVCRAALRTAEPLIRELAVGIVQRYAEAGGGDFVTEVGTVLPVETIALVIGLSPESARQIRELTEYAFTRLATDPECFAPLFGMIMTEVVARRAEPRDDFLTYVSSAEMLGGRPISDDDILQVLMGLIVAGHETTMNASANLALQLAQDPALRARMAADPSIVPAVVEEGLRFDSPVQGFTRVLACDVELDGVLMSQGDRVLLLYGSANHDPEVFDSPDVFDADRTKSKHYSFGWGLHRCAGAPLAQLELRILGEVLAGYDFSLAGEPQYAPPSAGGAFSGLRSLPLSFARTPS